MSEEPNIPTDSLSLRLAAANGLIRRRRTIKPDLMSDKPIEKLHLASILENANWAPTHGMTEPWRFTIFTEDAREELGDLMQEIYLDITPGDGFRADKYEKLSRNPMSAPVVISIGMKRQESEKIPEVEEIEASHTGAEQERNELLLRRGDYQRLSMSLGGELANLERQVLALVPQLPAPLQKRLEPLLVQIPEDADRTTAPLGQRMMNVLGVLGQAEKWNNTATFVGETRAIKGEQKVQVRTLYWGLAQAFYVDAQGETAGIGRPGDEGWVFEDDPSLASRAELLLDIYEGNVDTIAFVPLPVEIR